MSMAPVRVLALPAALLALAALACDGPTPVEPSMSVSATPRPTAAPPAGTWTVTVAVTEATGSFCVNLAPLGSKGSVLYTIEGVGTPTMTFTGPDLEWDSYTVAVNGLSFQAVPLALTQSVGCAAYTVTTQFSGTFSADWKSFTATARSTYVLTTGEIISRTWSWSGKQN